MRALPWEGGLIIQPKKNPPRSWRTTLGERISIQQEVLLQVVEKRSFNVRLGDSRGEKSSTHEPGKNRGSVILTKPQRAGGLESVCKKEKNY